MESLATFVHKYSSFHIHKLYLYLCAVKDSCHVTLVDVDVQTTAHKVILIALSPFIRNSC